MDYIFKLLPATLKIQLSKFRYEKFINVVPFLQDRPDTFYLNYLDKLKPMRFEKGEIIYEQGSKAREIFMNTEGEIRCTNLQRLLG